MSDVFSIRVSALRAFSSAVQATGHDAVANAHTPGHAGEPVAPPAAPPQPNGQAAAGSGAAIDGGSLLSQATANQSNHSQSSLARLNALQRYSGRVDDLLGTAGLGTALRGFYSAWSDVAGGPDLMATRQALLDEAQSVVDSFNGAGTQLDALNEDIKRRIASDVQKINTLTASISTLNQHIVATVQSGGPAPADLLDQRDQLVSTLSKLTGISTTIDTHGALNVFGNGRPLVLRGSTTAWATVANPFDASQLEIASQSAGGIISGSITSGDLGGLLAARDQIVGPAKNQLGRIAVAFSHTANSQHNAGLDLNGRLGANLFYMNVPASRASSMNTADAAATVSVASVAALTASDYLLSYQGGAWSLTDAATGSAVPLAGHGTAASPLTADGLSIVLSSAPASGDRYLIQPTARAAASLSLAPMGPLQIAAAGPVRATAAGSNAGTATIGGGTVLDVANSNLLATTIVQFLSPTTYSVDGAGSFAYVAGENIGRNGWQVNISGAPAARDSFTIQSNAGGTGDNRNAALIAGQQFLLVLGNGTVSVLGALSALITDVGAQAQQIDTAQSAQTAINEQAASHRQSVPGINLDEVAAKLLQWQQAYQASTTALHLASSLLARLSAVQAA
ncbi:MAG: flagellar hook-associated protein FlgK [Pseudomonadota bacterium]|nr:flagellar hook-associated protein FlgK [Pseudomonadota bacterium]